MDDNKLTIKEFLILTFAALLFTPVGIFIVFAPPMWWTHL